MLNLLSLHIFGVLDFPFCFELLLLGVVWFTLDFVCLRFGVCCLLCWYVGLLLLWLFVSFVDLL